MEGHADRTINLVHRVVGGRNGEGGCRLVGGDSDRLLSDAGEVVALLGQIHPDLEGPRHGVGLAPLAAQGEGGGVALVHGGLVRIDAHPHEAAVVPEFNVRRGPHLVLGKVAAVCRVVGAIVGAQLHVPGYAESMDVTERTNADAVSVPRLEPESQGFSVGIRFIPEWSWPVAGLGEVVVQPEQA